MDYQNLLTQFIKYLNIKGRSESTVIAYKKDLKQFFDYLNELPIEQKPDRVGALDTSLLEKYIESLKASEGFTLKTVSRKINSLRTFFKFLLFENKIGKNPAGNIRHPKAQEITPRILSTIEYRVLRDVARINLKHFTMIELMLQTGIRIGELSRIKKTDVIFNEDGKNLLSIEAFSTISSRKVELSQLASSALQDYLQKMDQPANDKGYLFATKSGNPVLIRNIRMALHRLFIKAGLHDATVNDLRNTFIVFQLQNGLRIDRLAEIVGHKKVSTTERYLPLLEATPQKTHNKITPL